MFGPHLIVDGSRCDKAKLADRLVIERILTDYPQAIGMTRIGGPYMFEYQSPDPAYSGISGLVLIAESHIALHTFPALDYFTMDIFSCKQFDHERAVRYIRDALHVREMDRTLLQRGLSFRGPHHGAHGATDELIAAASARNKGLAVTIGTLPPDDPLAPRPVRAASGGPAWPVYGSTFDLGTYGADAIGDDGEPPALRSQRARRLPLNAAAAGDRAPAGLRPVQPLLLNPTASISGLLDRLTTLGGPARQLGGALARWEELARTAAPVVLAIGPGIVAGGLREVVADLIRRGHVSAVIAEGDTALADCYESLGHRHYLATDAEAGPPVPGAAEWTAALAALRTMLRAPGGPIPSHEVLRLLGHEVAAGAPRPGIVSAAARQGIPVFAVGDTGLTQVGADALDSAADVEALRAQLARPGAGIVAFGTTEYARDFVAATGAVVDVIAIDAPSFASPTAASAIDATVALPILATGLVQRLPERPQPTPTAAEAATAR